MTENALAALPAEETTKPPPDDAAFSSPQPETPEPVTERNYEAEARKTGWKPSTEWKGERPANYIDDPKEWVERSENFVPFLQAQKRELEEQLAKERKDFNDRIARLEKASQSGAEALRRQHATEMAALREKMHDAVAAGDTATYGKLEKQVEDLQKQAPTADPATAPETDEYRMQKAKNWAASQPWFNSDFEMNKYAKDYHEFLLNTKPDLGIEANLVEVEEAVKAKFPDKFGGQPHPQQQQTRPAANAHAAVDGGGMINGSAPVRSQTPAFDKLPAEAKAFARNQIRSGAYPGGEKSETFERWAAAYNS